MSYKSLTPLLPARYRDTKPHLFSIDVRALSIKDANQHLEHPFFSLNLKPDRDIRHYADARGNSITLFPSPLGLPTILDKDVLIYAISHIMHQRNLDQPVSRRVVIYSADLLEFANRCRSGRDYRALEKAILRLRGCTIQTSVRTGDEIEDQIFGLLDSAALKRKFDNKGRLMHCEITLSEWLWRAIQANEVLTLHPDYFRLRRPIERRLYEIARKHCGYQPSWTIRLERLREKCASQSSLIDFRYKVRQIAKTNPLPDYAIAFAAEQDKAIFTRRTTSKPPPSDATLDHRTYQEALKAAPSEDIPQLHTQWLAWRARNKLPPPRFPRAAFVGFVRTHTACSQNAAALGAPPPRPESESINSRALAWWNNLSDEKRDALEAAHRIFRAGDVEFPRSDKQLIEYAAKVGLPKCI